MELSIEPVRESADGAIRNFPLATGRGSGQRCAKGDREIYMKKVLLMAAVAVLFAACSPKSEDTTTPPATPDTNSAAASTNK